MKNYKLLIVVVFAGLFTFCKKSEPQKVVPSPPIVNPVPTATFQKNLVLDSLMQQRLIVDAADNGAGKTFITTNITTPANNALTLTPQPVVYLQTSTTDNQAIVEADANRVFVLALQWAVMKDSPEATPYLNKARSYLLAWAEINKATDFMPGEVSYSKFIYAYSLIKAKLSSADKILLDTWLRERYTKVYKPFAPRNNNWETCRLNLIFDIAYVTGDVDMLNYAKQAYRTLLNVSILNGGSSTDLVGRDAYAYHAYNLLFHARILRSIYLQEGPTNGLAWRNIKNDKGESVLSMIMKMKPFMENPTQYVHIEFFNTEYAPDKTRSDYNKPFVPGSVLYVYNELVFSFPTEVMPTIKVLNATATPFNRTLAFYLNSLQLSRPI